MIWWVIRVRKISHLRFETGQRAKATAQGKMRVSLHYATDDEIEMTHFEWAKGRYFGGAKNDAFLLEQKRALLVGKKMWGLCNGKGAAVKLE